MISYTHKGVLSLIGLLQHFHVPHMLIAFYDIFNVFH